VLSALLRWLYECEGCMDSLHKLNVSGCEVREVGDSCMNVKGAWIHYTS
jgi:hypothetical protein